MMHEIARNIGQSYRDDKLAFITEALGVVLTIIASLTLTITAKNPNMVIIFPIYEISSILLLIAYYRRRMGWSVILMWYFVVLNVIGFLVAIH